VTSELRCTIQDARAAGFCGKGARAWCAKNGVDWKLVLSEGVPAQVLLETGDPLAARVVAAARAR
jgi:hypothetical protein